MIEKKEKLRTYPNAPVPVVMTRMGIVGSEENLCKIFCRRTSGQSPSILEYGMESFLKYFSIRFSVLVQQENIILRIDLTYQQVRYTERQG